MSAIDNNIDRTISAVEELLSTKLDIPVSTIGDLAFTDYQGLVQVAKSAEQLKRQLWRVQSKRSNSGQDGF